MNITISASWVYGHLVSDLGQYKVDPADKVSRFHWRGQVHASSWQAAVGLRNELWGRRGEEAAAGVAVLRLGGEDVICVQLDAPIGRLCPQPDPDALREARGRLEKALAVSGFADPPEPKLYFMVEVNDED